MINRLAIEPIPCPRPRATARGPHAKVYYPAEYQEWKNEVVKLLNQLGRPGFLTPSTDSPGWPEPPLVRLSAHFERTQPKTTKLRVPKGDVDNYVKALMDALTQAAWWKDDDQVVCLQVTKAWAPKGKPGSIRFTITEEVE